MRQLKFVGMVMGKILLVANAVVALCMLFCAYSPYINPVKHPVQACVGLAFPVFLVFTVLFLLFWLVVYSRYAVVSVVAMLCCAQSIYTVCPLHLFHKAVPQDAIKVLSYNVMSFESDHPDTPRNPNMILRYLSRSKADIICLQEYIVGGRLKQSDVDRVLADYPYKDIRKVSGSWNGLACYSRYPILSARNIEYKSSYNGSAIYRIKKGEDTLTVINNHLESNKLTFGDREIYVKMIKSPEKVDMGKGSRLLLGKLADATAIRAVQADTIAAVIRRHGAKNLIVCGDFNTSAISYTYRIISEGLIDAFVHSGNGLGISYHKNGFYFRIDNILTSPDLKPYRCEVDRSISNSDHYPIWSYVAPQR